MSEECCNHNCNQGRDCPLRKTKMNNEPVAWMSPEGFVYGLHETRPLECNIPLYTHPAQKRTMVLDGNRVYPCLKELTDEEIGEIYMDLHGDPIAFARAILKKAQEK